MQESIDTLLQQDELDNIDTEFDNEYNDVVDNIYVKTFYNTNEDI